MDEEGDIADGPNGPIIFRGGRWVPLTQDASQRAPQGNPRGILTRPAPAPKKEDAPSGYRFNPDGSLAPISGGPADTKSRKPMRQKDADLLEDGVQTYEALDRSLNNFQDDFGGNLFGGIENSLEGTFGLGTAGQRDWWADFYQTDNLIRNSLFGASLTDGEKAAYASTTITPRMSPDQIRRNLQRRREITRGALQRRAKRLEAGGFNPDEIEAGLGVHAPEIRGNTTSQAPERATATQSAATGLSLGSPGRTLAADEEVVFGDAPAQPRGRRLAPEAEGAIRQAIKDGDRNRAVALLEQFTGVRPPVDTIAIIQQQIDYNKKNPGFADTITFGYGDADQAAQEQYDFERYGNNLPEALRQREGLGFEPTVRAAGNSASMGGANYLSAALNTAFGQGDGGGMYDRFVDNLQRERAIDEADRRLNPNEALGGSIAGAVLNPLNRAGATPVEMIAYGGLSGGVQGALESQTPGEIIPRTLAGTAAGGIGGGIGGAVARTGRGLTPNITPQVRTLLNEGVELTPGQVLGQGGMVGQTVRRVEDIAAGAPIVGAPARAAQDRSVQSFNRAVLNRALRPIGERLPNDIPMGHDAVRFVGDRLSQGYTNVLPRLSGTRTNGFDSRVNTIIQRAALPTDSEGSRLLGNIRAELDAAFDPATGAYNGRTLRDVSERLGDLSAGWRRNDDPYIRMAGDTAARIREQLHGLARSQNPADAATLRGLDRGYASLVRAERAALNTDDGIITPARYNSAIRQSDQSSRKRAVARGVALDQDLASAGSRVMRNTAAQGGSRDVNALLGLGGLTYGLSTGDPLSSLLAAGLVANAGLGSRTGQNVARGLILNTGPALQAVAPVAGGAARGAAFPMAMDESEEFLMRQRANEIRRRQSQGVF